jgi:hypothetical protein
VGNRIAALERLGQPDGVLEADTGEGDSRKEGDLSRPGPAVDTPSQDDDVVSTGRKRGGEVAADEPGPTGDRYPHRGALCRRGGRECPRRPTVILS